MPASWASIGQVELAQPGDGPLEALAATPALRGEGRLERLVVRVHPEAEDVQLALPQAEVAGDDGVDLDAGQERHPGRDGAGRDDLAVARPACRGRSARAVRTPAAQAARTSSAGATTPSERVVCVCRSMVDGSGGSTLPAPRGGQRVMASATRSGRHVRPRRGAGCARWRGLGRWPGRCRSGPR